MHDANGVLRRIRMHPMSRIPYRGQRELLEHLRDGGEVRGPQVLGLGSVEEQRLMRIPTERPLTGQLEACYLSQRPVDRTGDKSYTSVTNTPASNDPFKLTRTIPIERPAHTPHYPQLTSLRPTDFTHVRSPGRLICHRMPPVLESITRFVNANARMPGSSRPRSHRAPSACARFLRPSSGRLLSASITCGEVTRRVGSNARACVCRTTQPSSVRHDYRCP